MIQFNLLPDVKLEYIKSQRTKRAVIGISIIVSTVALAIFIVLFLTVDVLQKKNISDLTKDIARSGHELQAKPNLSKMLTVQSQLNSLTSLHDTKPITSRLFDYMNQLTPSKVAISQLTLDMTTQKMSINGTAESLDAVNAFADSIKFTTYKVTGSKDTAQKAFSAVVLTSIDRDNKDAKYSIDLTFEPKIFSNANAITLTVNNNVGAQAASVILKR